MIEKRILCPERVRKIEGSFAFIEHRFLRDGFWVSLSHDELLLYLLLVIVADRAGLSYYGYDKLCTLLTLPVDEYIVARNALIEKDFIAFDGRLFQVLSLPEKAPRASSRLLRTPEEMADFDPATIHQSIRNALRGD
ncbi:MAG: hypothetical protein KGZ62_01820 [Sulfurimonas sp.]|nr:hypothetical protein [Sulfurimonas sp.]